MSDTAVEEQEVVQEEEVTEKDPISSSKKDLTGDEKGQLKAKALVHKIFDAKDNMKDVKNALKAYKITSEPLEELKAARKELTQQINDEKDRIEGEFQKDDTYMKLREQKLDAEEKIAVAKQELRIAMMDETLEKQFVEMKLEVNGVPMKLQTQVKVDLYFNGKVEK
ncbi:MAG: hypothetical protein P1V18_03950 [Candidatus Gracilibacteria bacterium]|nr:hypothetical protein [Candidatus Gracilibacteria bacterium]